MIAVAVDICDAHEKLRPFRFVASREGLISLVLKEGSCKSTRFLVLVEEERATYRSEVVIVSL